MSEKENNCTCGNPKFGFDCTCEWSKNNPGSNTYCCEFCGIYEASRPRCNKCELDEGVPEEDFSSEVSGLFEMNEEELSR